MGADESVKYSSMQRKVKAQSERILSGYKKPPHSAKHNFTAREYGVKLLY